jgi:hypothetical protein
MGRRSREHWERQRRRVQDAAKSSREAQTSAQGTDRTAELEAELRSLADGDAVFWTSPDCPAEVRESNLEDILAFESVGSGTSLFEGLQEHGVDLPQPEKLDEMQCARKALEVMHALADLRIFLVGYDHMTARELYSTLWNETLWEGCYVEKRHPGALTVIDVSHLMTHSEVLQFLQDLGQSSAVQ